MQQKTLLANGLRVVSERIDHVRSISIGIWVGAGSRRESAREAGLSHFLEHLMFKGTASRSARELAEDIDAIGGQLNAYTTKEYTCYYVKILDQHLETALEILADMLLNSRFDGEDIAKEKGVVAEEIKLYEDTPDELVHDLFAQCLWPRHALGRPVLGTQDAIERFDREDVLRFYGRFYVPGDTVIAAAGHVDHDRLVSEVARRFGDWSVAWRPPVEPPAVPGPGRCVRVKDVEQVHLCVGTSAVSMGDPDIYALLCLANLMGGGSSSRLFQEIREERGLAYAVYSFQSAYRDTGLLGVYAGSSPETAGVVLELVLQELERFRREGPTPGELQRTKEQLKTNMVLSLESTSTRMSRLGRSELVLGRTMPADEAIAAIDAVTADDLVRLADAFFRTERMAVAAVAPVADPFGGRLPVEVVAG